MYNRVEFNRGKMYSSSAAQPLSENPFFILTGFIWYNFEEKY